MRAVPLPELEKKEEIKLDEISSDINVDDFSSKAVEIGIDALNGKDGPAKDTLVYTGAITLSIIKNIDFFFPFSAVSIIFTLSITPFYAKIGLIGQKRSYFVPKSTHFDPSLAIS